jgi:hypothetical protein
VLHRLSLAAAIVELFLRVLISVSQQSAQVSQLMIEEAASESTHFIYGNMDLAGCD